jgi:hypothetical protein
MVYLRRAYPGSYMPNERPARVTPLVSQLAATHDMPDAAVNA